MMDSVPLVAITGQVPRKLIGTDGFQARRGVVLCVTWWLGGGA
jgi:thiamine pyrophosphate-dependent acetolactate synthase large subunit-like protein